MCRDTHAPRGPALEELYVILTGFSGSADAVAVAAACGRLGPSHEAAPPGMLWREEV